MKKNLLTAMLILFCAVPMRAQMKWNQQFQQYFDQYKDMAIDQMRRYHIPASITSASSVTDGRVEESITMTTGTMSVSGLTIVRLRVMKTILSSCPPVRGIARCSN